MDETAPEKPKSVYAAIGQTHKARLLILIDRICVGSMGASVPHVCVIHLPISRYC